MNYAQLHELVKRRRSIYPKDYTDRPISDETIMKIIELANWAPTHEVTQPWRFIVYKSEASREKLSAYFGKDFIDKGGVEGSLKHKKMLEKPLLSNCVIAIIAHIDPEADLPEWEEIAAVSMAVQNMWLGCTTLGMGSFWSSPSSITRPNGVIDLKEGERCLGLFYMGYSEATPPAKDRSSIAEKIRYAE